jgi:hypothetical protein
MIVTEQARRKTVAACQAALTKRGGAVLAMPSRSLEKSELESLLPLN